MAPRRADRPDPEIAEGAETTRARDAKRLALPRPSQDGCRVADTKGVRVKRVSIRSSPDPGRGKRFCSVS